MIQRTDKELKELAFYIFENKVFGSWSFRDANQASMLMGSVFMSAMFMPEEERNAMKEAGVIHFYEFYDKALPRSINGCPIFMSMHLILREEWDKITKHIDALVEQRKEFMDEEVTDEVNWHQPMGG